MVLQVSQAWVWPKLDVLSDACVQRRLDILSILFYAVWHESPAECSTLEGDCAKPVADDPTVKLISFSHKTLNVVRPGQGHHFSMSCL